MTSESTVAVTWSPKHGRYVARAKGGREDGALLAGGHTAAEALRLGRSTLRWLQRDVPGRRRAVAHEEAVARCE